MIELTNVYKTYANSVKAVDNLNLIIPDGEIFGFLGPNGAGKTTTIKLITGILNADSGSIKVNGLDIEKDSLKVKKQIGFVPDTPNMFLRLKGKEYLNFMADMYDVSTEERRERIDDLARRFGMTDVLQDRIQSHSHGMRQKIVREPWFITRLYGFWMNLRQARSPFSFQLKEMMREHADNNKTVFFYTCSDVAEKV